MENVLDGERIIKVNIENQMKSAYIDYSMSVIVSRALPDARDGLKPVHRRVLFGMHEIGVLSNRPYKKSARIVGEVLGKYHPHGDTSVYDSMVRMAQEWSLRYPLVQGQGNFGSIDGDNPAAMRYTEVRLRKIAEEMLVDIEKDTVDHQLNFDDSLKEPIVLPTQFPNLLVNGASGIAVGMATNMAPHNLTQVIDGTLAYIDNREIEMDDLIRIVQAPDFPTGGIIYGYEGVKSAFETGRGRVMMRGDITVEESSTGKERLVVSSIPFQVNKAEMIRKTADLINDKRIDGISDINDESDRNGMRIVYDLKRDAIPNIVINKLYQLTALQSSFSVNNVALVKGRPRTLNLKDLIHYFVEHRHEVVTKRTEYELKEAEKKAHILEGLLVALDNLDEVITLIRASQTPEEARNGLITKFGLTELQARAILDMRLQKLTGLERGKIKNEYQALQELITKLKAILDSFEMKMDIVKEELIRIKELYGDERRSEVVYTAEDISMEDLIPDEQVVITISHMGYIKRTPLTEYRQQRRGGRGSKGSTTRNEDFLEHLFVATNHNYMLFFTEKGKVFWMRVFEIPEGNKVSKGRAIQNLINISPDDKVKAIINTKDLKDEDYINSNFIMLATKKGVIKKTSLEAYSRPRQNGINAITIREGDELLEARLTNGENNVLLAVKSGKTIRFNEEKVRAMGRNAAGVRGITLGHKKDELIGMICVENNEEVSILVVSEKGYGKRSELEDYRLTNRGGKGVKTLNITDKTGQLIAIKSVTDNDDLMIINKSGITIRMAVKDLRVMGRATQGVRLIRIDDGDEIAAVAKVEVEEDEDQEYLDGEVIDSDVKLEDTTEQSEEDKE
ncbi:MAG: DNA gyrase subunit A [Lentimicrobiaceae bacterium]|nr:DNA gyrase subunit A [Lentimicrobiaceae bacterium]MBT3454637.1 DNA gyrase subunit A [Lentimicrobiaceae bacterium]MBT3818335.1 DNA gyrase subunit A [Lentimicrobiaceae bacterium]MBT4062184.1 DNA gyrase subunit A [Lentimicrobiaceae bacterium]MBT4190011.1 DNA gyrase subunit A [Lentimicrobiaceae bacterium]